MLFRTRSNLVLALLFPIKSLFLKEFFKELGIIREKQKKMGIKFDF
jgi:hypothetical protein